MGPRPTAEHGGSRSSPLQRETARGVSGFASARPNVNDNDNDDDVVAGIHGMRGLQAVVTAADDAAANAFDEKEAMLKDRDVEYAQIDPLFAFGADKRVKPGMGIAYINDSTIVFPIGSQLAVSRTDTHVMSFFPLLDKIVAVNGVVTAGHETPGSVLVGVVEELRISSKTQRAGNLTHQVSVYRFDSRRRIRVFRMDDSLTRGEVVGLAFSKDAQHVVIQYGDSVSFGSSHDPDYIAAYFSLTTGKMTAGLTRGG